MQSDESTTSPTLPRRRVGCVAWFALTGLAALVIVGLVLWSGVQAGRDFFGFLGGLPAKFQTQTITHSFKESLIRVDGTQGDILEVATLEMSETLTDYDIKTALGNIVYLGTTISEIKVPVVYRYHIKLSDEWKLSVKGNVCTVLAPEIRPSLPPAIRTDQMEKKSQAGWLRFNAAENMADLERKLTPTAERRAGTPHRINQVREPARKAVVEFVKQWLMRAQQWSPDDISAIVVHFPDEPKETVTPPAVYSKPPPSSHP